MLDLPRRRRGVRHLAATLAIIGPLTLAPSCASPSAGLRRPPDPSAAGIADERVYVSYNCDGGRYRVQLPKGWQRSISGSTVQAATSLNRVVATSRPGNAPTKSELASVTNLSRLQQLTGISVISLRTASDVKLPVGPALRSLYVARSAADSTGHATSEDLVAFTIPGPGRYASLVIVSPAGSDVADLSKIITDSFRWKQV